MNPRMKKPPTPEVEYPERDGRPMAETDLHRDLMLDLIATLQDRFANDPMVYVSGNLLVFYAEGDGKKHVSPDVFVVRGVAKRRRRNYLIWKEGRPPEMVIELTSMSTRIEDLEDKYNLYQELGVSEYFMFDPRDEYLEPRLVGYRLQKGAFREIKPLAGRLPSKVLGLELMEAGQQLRLWDPVAGRTLLTRAEKADWAERRAAEAEAQVERLEREMEQLKHRSG